jgi:tRNA nucleotidyltransferase/poly(A) polymerase
VFALKNSTNVVMKYKDNEGDLVTIATDSELECALTHQLHHNLLRLSLFTNVTKASHAPVATTEEEEDALAASVPSSEVTASSREDKLKKWKEMKEHKKTMREELKELKRRLRDELKNMSDDKDPQAMKELMEQRRKMWKQMRKMRGHCVRWRKECEEGDSSSDEEKKPKDPQAMKELMEQRRKMWQHMKELKRKKREECKKDLLESNHGVCQSFF